MNLEGGDCLAKDWEKVAKDIRKTPIWLKDGEAVDVVFGAFEETTTERTDKKTGKPYKTEDFVIEVRLADGTPAYRKVSKWVLAEIIETAVKADKNKDGEVFRYVRPQRNFQGQRY